MNGTPTPTEPNHDVRERVRAVLVDAARHESFEGTDIDHLTDAVLAAMSAAAPDEREVLARAFAEHHARKVVYAIDYEHADVALTALAARLAPAVSAADPDERERAQRYTTVLAHLNREQARAEAAEAEVDALRARIELLAREYDDAIPGFVRRLRAALAARPAPAVSTADADVREALVDAVVDQMRRAYSRPGDPMEPARLRRQAEEVVDLLAARPARGGRATDPLIVSAIRRHPNGTLRYEPANGPATGTSGRSFLAEYDAALAARPAPTVNAADVEITTAAELDALPAGTIVRDRFGGYLAQGRDAMGVAWFHYPVYDHAGSSALVAGIGPVTVCFTPGLTVADEGRA